MTGIPLILAGTAAKWRSVFLSADRIAARFWREHYFEPETLRWHEDCVLRSPFEAEGAPVDLYKACHGGQRSSFLCEGAVKRSGPIRVTVSFRPPLTPAQALAFQRSIAMVIVHEYVHYRQRQADPVLFASYMPEAFGPYPMARAALKPEEEAVLRRLGASSASLAYYFSPCELEAWAVCAAYVHAHKQPFPAHLAPPLLLLPTLADHWQSVAAQHGLRLAAERLFPASTAGQALQEEAVGLGLRDEALS